MSLQSDDDALRQRIGKLLSGAISVPWVARALTQETFDATVRALQDVPRDDLVGKLVTGGFTDHPYLHRDETGRIEHACKTCLYYERHRRFCNLPSLMLPVEPQWSCIVWRI